MKSHGYQYHMHSPLPLGRCLNSEVVLFVRFNCMQKHNLWLPFVVVTLTLVLILKGSRGKVPLYRCNKCFKSVYGVRNIGISCTPLWQRQLSYSHPVFANSTRFFTSWFTCCKTPNVIQFSDICHPSDKVHTWASKSLSASSLSSVTHLLESRRYANCFTFSSTMAS